MGWVFQGNPIRFDIDDYLSRYPEIVYWRTPRHAGEIQIGDRAFIWRARDNSGAVAIGAVVESPTARSSVTHPEALGDDLWRSEEPDPSELVTGIRIEEVRLLPSEGLVSRSNVKANTLLSKTTLISMPNGTVFPLSENEQTELEKLWGILGPSIAPLGIAASEGEKRLVSHYKRERSRWLKQKKIEEFLKTHGLLKCEVCSTTESLVYPPELGRHIFEVHHLQPLSEANKPIRTTLEQLAIVCANCHRAIHADKNVEKNYETLQKKLKK